MVSAPVRQGRKTIVCVHGLASAALECRKVGEEKWNPSYCHIGPLVAHPSKFLTDLKLRLESARMEDGSTRTCVADAEGLEFRPFDGIDGLRRMNPCEHAPPINVWSKLVDGLKHQHYNPISFNYDWRKWGCPRYSKTLVEKFRVLIERNSIHSGPVTVVAHSMGGPVLLYVLNMLGKEWQEENIKDVILVAPAPMGSACMVPSYSNNPVTAVSSIFHAPRILEHAVEETTATWAGMVSEMPLLVGGIDTHPDYPIVITSEREYYAKDMGDFVKKLHETVKGREFATALWPSVTEIASAMHAPAVLTSIIFDNGQDTISQVSYVDVGDDLSKAPKPTKYEKGDNTVIASSVEKLGMQWRAKGAKVRIYNTPDQIDHKNLIAGKYTVQMILDILAGKIVDERTLADSFAPLG